MPHYNVYGSDSEWYVDICLYLLVFEICNQFVGVADFELLFLDSSVLWNFSNLGLVNQRSNPKSHLFIPFEFLLSQSGIGYWNSSTMRIGSSNTYIIFILYLLHLFFFLCARNSFLSRIFSCMRDFIARAWSVRTKFAKKVDQFGNKTLLYFYVFEHYGQESIDLVETIYLFYLGFVTTWMFSKVRAS